MSQENVEWLREVSEARAREDTEAVEALLRVGLAAEFELQPLYPDRVYRGAEEMRKLWTDAVETWEDYRFETEEIIDLGEHVLVLAHITGRGTGSGVPIDQRIGILVAFQGEKAVWARSFLSKQEALEAAGLRE
jgi:ketosteroid isomerase-like protein